MIDVTELEEDIDIEIQGKFIYKNIRYTVLQGELSACLRCAFNKIDCTYVMVPCTPATRKDNTFIYFTEI